MSRQTVTSGNSWLRANNQWSLNADDQAADQFSALDTLEKHRAASGAFTLQLVFPGTDLPPQTWKQTSNPVTATRSNSGVEGYEPIDVPHTGCYWGGLERSGGSSLLDGSVSQGDWWYAVGARRSHRRGIPGPCNHVVQQLELWVLSSWASLTPPPSLPPSLPPPAPPLAPPLAPGSEWKLILRSDLSPDDNEACQRSGQVCASTLGDFSSGVQVGTVNGTGKFRIGMTGAELSAAGVVRKLRVTTGSREIEFDGPIDATAFDVSCTTCNCPAGGVLIAGSSPMFWSAGRGGCWGSTHFGLTGESDTHAVCGQGSKYGHFHRGGVDTGVYVFGDECINENEWEETFSIFLLIDPLPPPSPSLPPADVAP